MYTFNFQKSLLFITVFVGVVLINSCSVSTSTSSKGDTANGYAENTNFDVPLQTPLNMTIEQHNSLDMDYFTSKKYEYMGFNRWMDVAWRTNDWHSADQLGKAVIRGAENDKMEFHIAQWISYSMIRGLLLKQEPTLEVKEAIAYYLNLLHKYNSFRDAKVIFQALERLQGLWTDEQISQFADDVFRFREVKQQIASKTKIPNAEERLRQRAKKMIEATPQMYSGADAEEKLVQKLRLDREEAQKKISSETWSKIYEKELQAEQEEATFTVKLQQLAKRK